MKKAIIILTILSIITLGFGVYEGYLYFESLNELNAAETAKDELIKTNIDLEKENTSLEVEYKEKTQELIKNNTGCELWKNQEEVLKKTTE